MKKKSFDGIVKFVTPCFKTIGSGFKKLSGLSGRAIVASLTVMLLVSVMSVIALAAPVTNNIHWSVVRSGGDVILYLGNIEHTVQTGEAMYPDGNQSSSNKGSDGLNYSSVSDAPYFAHKEYITKVVIESEISPANCSAGLTVSAHV